jgi:hypothetical protein
VETLHAADRMLHEDTGSRMLPIMFCLRGGQLWFWVGFRFSGPFVRQVYCRLIAIIFIRPEKTEVKPHLDPIKPRGLGVEYGFHEGVVVDASGDETEEKEDLSVQGRDGEGLERVVFFFYGGKSSRSSRPSSSVRYLPGLRRKRRCRRRVCERARKVRRCARHASRSAGASCPAVNGARTVST